MRETLELILQDFLERGLIEGYEIPLNPQEGVKIFVSKYSEELVEKLRQKLRGIPLKIEETGPIEAEEL